PAYELIKDMIVYDPSKRYSADRLLRKSYFYEIKNTDYECKIIEFEKCLRNKAINNLSKIDQNSNASINRQSSIIKKQGPGGDRFQILQTHSVNAETFDRLSAEINQNIDQSKLDKRKSNLHKILCSKTNLQNSMIIPEPENIRIENRKQNIRSITCSKDNTKDISPSKQMLTTSVSALNKSSVIRNVRNKCVNRPPFK
ncbi:PREDICTED: uncharacterized protein LOC107162199, partial [Diuraphis noxia]|uniref:uncharacterized protein LOC107162199 n=1 Tax=Diuraphis noxia TaxID=143948 RepID=UPI0007639DF8